MYRLKYIRKIFGVLAAMLLTSTISMVAFAADAEPIDTRTAEGQEISTEDAYAMTVDSNSWEGWPQGYQTYGEGDIVMDAESGAILYAKNIDGKAYPASITKVVTMLIALENGKLDDKITFSADSVGCVPYGYAHIGMKAGEELTLEQALYGMMLASANEVAYAIGESVGKNAGKDYDWFIQQMNERCKELGGLNSNFVNTNGLDDDNHYTSARDMALITRELLLNHPEFETVSQTLQYTIPATSMSEARTFQQNHKMFYQSHKNYDARVIAGKTGYTDRCKNTLVTCAQDGDRKLICIALKTHGTNVYDDTENLLNYGFDNFEQLDVASLETSEDIGSFVSGSKVTVPKGVTFSDLKMELTKNSNNPENGTVVYTYNGQTVGTFEVTYSQSYIDLHMTKADVSGKSQSSSTTTMASKLKTIVKYIIIAVCAIIAILFIIVIALIIRKKKIQRERKRRRRQRAARQSQEEKRRQNRR